MMTHAGFTVACSEQDTIELPVPLIVQVNPGFVCISGKNQGMGALSVFQLNEELQTILCLNRDTCKPVLAFSGREHSVVQMLSSC